MDIISLLRKGHTKLKRELTRGDTDARVLANLRIKRTMTYEELHASICCKKSSCKKMAVHFAINNLYLNKKIACIEKPGFIFLWTLRKDKAQ